VHHRPQIAAGQRKAAKNHDEQDNDTDYCKHEMAGPV
jgi:hypothetical protein